MLGVVNAYLNTLDVDVETRCELSKYLDLVKCRANGKHPSASRMNPFLTINILTQVL